MTTQTKEEPPAARGDAAHVEPTTTSIDVNHEVVIIGGGTAGITVAARLLKALKGVDVAVIEPSEHHYYQPLWTLVAAGVFPKERSQRPEASVMPDEATWIRDRVTEIDPDRQVVTLASGKRVGYAFLIVAPGLQVDWGRVEGLPEVLGSNGVCSIYDFQQAEKTWDMLRTFEGGTALFTAPATPIKCGGAPQKIMYLADDVWRNTGVRDKVTMRFVTAGSVLFGVEGFRETLQGVVDRKNIDTQFRHDLVALRPDKKEAIFRLMDQGDEEVAIPYDLIHVSPPMSAPAFIKRSKLAYADGPMKGWLNVDQYTLQHAEYANVFGLGDVAGLPTAKTGAAVRKQAPVVVENLMTIMQGQPLGRRAGVYDGYSSCPLVTGFGKMVLAEFSYGNEPAPSLPIDTTKERYSMYLLKKYGLPFLYWNLMLKGRA